MESPKTQSIGAVKVLLAWKGRAVDSLPSFVELAGGVRLTLSSKGDVYYTTTPTNCSCPARTYHPGKPCKHMKALLTGNSLAASQAQARAYQAHQREAKTMPAPAVDSIRPDVSHFRPVSLLPCLNANPKDSAIATVPPPAPRRASGCVSMPTLKTQRLQLSSSSVA